MKIEKYNILNVPTFFWYRTNTLSGTPQFGELTLKNKMKYLATLTISTLLACVHAEIPIRILQKNIRADGLRPYPNEKPWSVRLPGVISELSYHLRTAPLDTFITLQEVKDNQLQDLISNLNQKVPDKYGKTFTRIDNFNNGGKRFNQQKNGRLDYDIVTDPQLYTGPGEWSYIGVGRDNGVYAGEYSPIFYRPSRWRVVQWQTSWMTDVPTAPGRSWGGSNVRIVTIGYFQSTQDPRHFVTVMSTHLDDNYPWDNDVPRQKSLTFLSQIFDWWTGRDKSSPYAVPCVLGGDFNGETNDPAYPNIKNGTQNGNILEELQRNPADYYKIWGPLFTYTAFGGEWFEQPLDYIFVSPWTYNQKPQSRFWKIDGYAVSSAEFGSSNNTVDRGDRLHAYNDNPILNSDHRLLIGDLRLKLRNPAPPIPDSDEL